MDRYELNESLITGVRMIDTHHRELIEAINDLANAIEKGEGSNAVKKILSFLEFYAEWHFDHEEKCAYKHQCPMADINKQAHIQFLDTVKKYKIEYRENPDNQIEIASKIHHELADWLVRHIQGIDVKLGKEMIAAGV
jgi:hemerythrin